MLVRASVTSCRVVESATAAASSSLSARRDNERASRNNAATYLLADVLRTDRRRLQPVTTDAPDTGGMRMLIRARHDLVVARVAAHNQLRQHLLRVSPAIANDVIRSGPLERPSAAAPTDAGFVRRWPFWRGDARE